MTTIPKDKLMHNSEFHDSCYCRKSTETSYGGDSNFISGGFAASQFSFSVGSNFSVTAATFGG